MVYTTSSANQKAGTKVNVSLNTNGDAVPPKVSVNVEIADAGLYSARSSFDRSSPIYPLKKQTEQLTLTAS